MKLVFEIEIMKKWFQSSNHALASSLLDEGISFSVETNVLL